MITLFPHQLKAVDSTIKSWANGVKNTLTVIPTGGGKTYIKAEFAKRNLNSGGVTLVFAHRDVLLSQISMSMCDMKVPHSFIASNQAVRSITNFQMEKLGQTFHNETSPVIITSVDTFNARLKKGALDRLTPRVNLWMMDEAHHLLKGNKWGRCVKPLVNAKGLGVTATPIRGDKKGLGSHADGVFDDMNVGATMGELISIGRLSPYQIFVPPQILDTNGLVITPSGDVNQAQLAERTDKAEITGDAVEHYLKLTPGQQAITFTVNINHADHVAAEFNKAGVPSVSVSSKTPLATREKYLQDFKAGRVLNLVNCDLFGEGFDVPAVSVVIMLRFTESYSLFKQQFGRMLRVIDGKEHGTLIDHVGNVRRHCIYGYPHDDPEWTLDRLTKRRKTDLDGPVGRVCPECFSFYLPKGAQYFCNNCRHEETPVERDNARSDFQASSGQLVKLDVDLKGFLLKEKAKVDQPVEVVKNKMQMSPVVVRNSAIKNHIKRQHAQGELRPEIQNWCEKCFDVNGWSVTTIQQEFELTFGVNILKAQSLSERKALELTEKIRANIRLLFESQSPCHTPQ